MKPEHVKIMFRLVFQSVSLFLRICQLVIGMMRSGHFVQRTADQVNKHPDWFMCVLTFQGLGLVELNGTVRAEVGIFCQNMPKFRKYEESCYQQPVVWVVTVKCPIFSLFFYFLKIFPNALLSNQRTSVLQLLLPSRRMATHRRTTTMFRGLPTTSPILDQLHRRHQRCYSRSRL